MAASAEEILLDCEDRMDKAVSNLGERLKAMVAAEDRAGEYIRATTYFRLAYASNRIPEIAEAILDVRFPPPHTIATMSTLIDQLAGDQVNVETIVAAESTHLKTDQRFVEISGEVAGKEAKTVQACGGSDARFFCAEGISVMLSRPYVGNLHGRDEWIEIDSMLDYFEICRRYVLEKTGRR